ncbi:MAG: MarR family transcriptional regulator [Bacteroidia bacterium]
MQRLDNRTPLGFYFRLLSKKYAGVLTLRLADLEIDRYYFYLLIIYQNDRMTQQELADYLKIDKAFAMKIVNYLSEHGLLERRQNPSDKRKHLLAVTPEGEKLLPLIEKEMHNLNREAMAGLNQDQIAAFYTVLQKMWCNMYNMPEEELELYFKLYK